MDLQNNIDFERNSSMVGQYYDVIIDEIANNIAVGRTQYDAPEIDKIVRINAVSYTHLTLPTPPYV